MTEEQKNVIYAAIATAKRDKPNMLLIEKADMLLQELNRTQKPKVTQRLSKREQAKVAFASQYIEVESKREHRSEAPLFLQPYVIGPIIGILTGAVIYYGQSTIDEKYDHRYTFEEARQYCNEKGQVLPLLTTDIPQYYRFSADGYWAADGSIVQDEIQAIIRGPQNKLAKFGQKYKVVCVDENNVTGRQSSENERGTIRRSYEE